MLIFETHATSADNEARLASGWFDVDLSPTGERQARELGERRAGEVLAAVYCSDLRRSFRTAEIAFGSRRVPIVRDPRLRECDYGTLTRHPVEDLEALRQTYIDVPFPNGESYMDVVRRVRAWSVDARQEHGSATVLVVAHRATYYAFEHLFRHRAPADVIGARWQWQPGWNYQW